jgi:acetyl-CoA C-acetyltransferase
VTGVSIVGVGLHPFGRFGEKTAGEIGREAVKLALQDAGVEWRDIDTAYMSTMYLPATSGARILRPLGATGVPICDVEAACASGGVALRQAIIALQSGAHELALVVGVEKMPKGFMDPLALYQPQLLGHARASSHARVRNHGGAPGESGLQESQK